MNALLVLAIESSAARSAVALLEGGQLLALREFPRGAGGVGAGSPAAAAEAALAGIGRKAADIGLVAVSVGPGSYTGLRIGVSFAKTFAWATGAAVVAVPSLAALAETAVAPPAAVLVPTADAFRGQLYARAFRRDASGALAELTGDLVLAPAELISRLAEIRSAPATDNRPLATGHCCFGSGAARHREALEAAARAAGVSLQVEAEPASPAAETVGRLGLELFLAGKTVTAHDLVPVYLRKTEAEERAAAREGKAQL